MTSPIVEKDLGAGVNYYLPETKLPSGAAVDIVNGIARSTGSIVKRPGWRLAAGYTPIRATNYVESAAAGGTITLTLPTSLSMTGLVSTPVIISGRTTQSGAALGQTASSIYASSFTYNAGSHTLTIAYATAGNHTESSPEIDIYGLLAVPAYSPSPITADLTSSDSAYIPNLLQEYNSPSISGLVCIRGGVPYLTSSATSDAVLYPTAVASPTVGLTGAAVVGPALYASTPGVAPARGYITSSGVASNGYASVTAITYNSSPGTTTYTLSLPAYSASAAISSIIRPGVDYLTVAQASRSSLAGDFQVVSVTAVDANTIAIETTNSANAASDAQYSDANATATAAILTDTFPVAAAPQVPPGSPLAFSDSVVDAADLYSYASSTASCVVGPLYAVLSTAGTTMIGMKRTASVVPLTSVTGLLRGDELVCSSDGLLRCVLGVNPNANQSASIVVSGGVATATVASTSGLRVGDYVLICQASVTFGEVQLASVPSGTSFTFSTTVANGTYTAQLTGHTLWLETPVTTSLVGTYGVNRRWAAIPCAYDSTLGVQPATPITNKPFQTPSDRGVTVTDYSPHFSAAVVNRAMYVTDGVNPVKKFDGVSMQNAGLINLPPILFTLKEQDSGGIAPTTAQYDVYSPISTYKMGVAAGTASAFTAGDFVCIKATLLGSAAYDAGASHNISVTATGSDGVATAGTWQVIPGMPVVFQKPANGASGFFTDGGIVAGTTYYLGRPTVSGSTGRTLYNIYTSQTAAVNGDGTYLLPTMGASVLPLVIGDRRWLSNYSATSSQLTQGMLFTTVTATDTTNNTITVADPLSGIFYFATGAGVNDPSFGAPSTVSIGQITKAMQVKYYSKLTMTDRNGNVTVSAGMGAQDYYMQVGIPTTVHGVLLNYPTLPDTQLARIQWQTYRTGGTSGSPPYYLVASNTYDFTTSPHPVYASFTDTVQPSQLTDTLGTGIGQTDPNSTLTGGNTSGPLFDRPPLAKYASSISGRLALANLKSPHRMTIAFRKRGGAPVQPTSQFQPRFVFTKGTTAPTTIATGAGQVGLCAVASAQNTACQMAQGSTGEVYMETFTLTSGDFVYTFDGSPRTELVGADMYGWWYTDSTQTWPRVGVAFTATATAGSVWNVTSGSIASLANGSPIYLRAWSANTSTYPLQTTYYIQVASATTFNVYLTQVDALAASGTNKVSPYGTLTGYWAAGDASAYPTGVFQWAQYGYSGLTGVVPVIMDQAYGSSISEVAYNTGGGHAQTPTSSIEQQLANRLANAINGGQAAYAYSHSTAQPFITARSGNDVGYATVLVEAIDPSSPFLFTFIPQNQDGNFDVYVNGVLYTPAANLTSISGTMSSQQLLFPSRISISPANYPETHDNPYTQTPALPGASVPIDSITVMDIAPDDGQQITGIVPFFGPSFSTAAQQNQYFLVTKERTVYLVDPIQRVINYVASAGHGCEFPRLLSEVYSAIGFADHTGIQCVRGNVTGSSTVWTYYGQSLERLWRNDVVASLAAPTVPVARHSTYHNLWRVAVPTTSSSYNDCIITYDYTREQASVAYGQLAGTGAWSRASGTYPVTFAAFSSNDYYADAGSVYMERRDGVATDYRDYPQLPIDYDVQLRPIDCEDPGIRKRAAHVTIAFRSPVSTYGTTVQFCTDLSGEWLDADAFDISIPVPNTKLSDLAPRTMVSLSFSLPQMKFQYLQVRVLNSSIDEPVELAEVCISVDPLTTQGVVQAASTTTK